MTAGPAVPARPAVAGALDRRVAWRSRSAAGALVLVLLAVSAYAVWSSQGTARASARAVAATTLADDYARVARAVQEEESLERAYRLDPGPTAVATFEDVTADVRLALADVERDGSSADRRLVARVRVDHDRYLHGMDRLFRAVDAGDGAEAARVDRDEVDPLFEAVHRVVVEAAAAQHDVSLAQLAHLQHLTAGSRRLTPLVFLVGLALAGVLASVTLGHRRLLVAERARAVHDSLHDALTGLPNRTLLGERIEQALRTGRRDSAPTALLLIDLDRFKEINDTFGHHLGDALLRQVGPRLIASLREVDTVARLGGDEFAVLLPRVRDLDDAVAVAGKLREALEQGFTVEGVALDVEASIGVVVSGQHGDDAAVLLQRADIAMYAAKTAGRGVGTYDPDVDVHSPVKVALLGDLRRGLERGELVLHYQPKISLTTGDVVGAEALVRWQHPERGLLAPDRFVPLAESSGLIGPLTRTVLSGALRQARAWSDAGRPLAVSVNLSARNLLDEDLPRQVEQALAEHGVPAELLELEVTESAIMTDAVRAAALLQRLTDLGVRIALDDFGAGYTSLSQLRTLPVTELKVDKSFVLRMHADSGNALIVRSVIDLGHNLGLTLVAEGVEDEVALEALRGFGCDVAQGYHLSRPLTADAFDAWRCAREEAARAPLQRGPGEVVLPPAPRPPAPRPPALP